MRLPRAEHGKNAEMPHTEKYEVLIIGSGEAGKYLAWTMGKQVIGQPS